MKTTVDIAPPLLREARKVAAGEGTTLRSLIEQGLRRVLAEKGRNPHFVCGLVTTGGRGLRPDLGNTNWDEIRDVSYRRGNE